MINWMRSAGLALAIAATPLSAAPPVKTAAPGPDPIIGSWMVQHPTAGFPLHLYSFGADHTVHHAVPDASNGDNSDSAGMGVWERRGDKIVGKWVELTAQRSTHKFLSRNEMVFEITVTGNQISGAGSFFIIDASGKITAGPIPAPFTGLRITPP